MNKIIFSVLVLVLAASCQSGREKQLATIQENEKKLFSDSLKSLDEAVASVQVEAYQSFADKYPSDSLSPEFMFKAADLSNSHGRGKEAIAILESLRQSFPDHVRAGTGLFMQGFIYETSFHDNPNAISKYSEFIEKYPDHQLAQAAEFSLIQLKQGMSVEDVVKMFEAKSDSAEKVNQ